MEPKEYDYNLLFAYNFCKWPYTDFTSRKPKVALLKACEIFEKLGVTYWLAFGVALGFHRQDDFIPYDSDIDMCVKLDFDNFEQSKQTINKIWDAFTDEYFRPIRIVSFGEVDKYTMQASFINEHRVPIDIFFLYENIEKDHVVQFNEKGILRFRKEHIDAIKKVKFKHGTFPIPTPTDEFLEDYYGSDWKTPTGKKKKNWENEARGKAFELRNTPWSIGNDEWFSRWKYGQNAKQRSLIKR